MNADGGTDDVFATVFHGMLTVGGTNSGSTIAIYQQQRAGRRHHRRLADNA
jgi:hypothetical protein